MPSLSTLKLSSEGSWTRANIDQPVPSTAIRISHFGWISRPVTTPATGISNNVAMPPTASVSPDVVASYPSNDCASCGSSRSAGNSQPAKTTRRSML